MTDKLVELQDASACSSHFFFYLCKLAIVQIIFSVSFDSF